MSQGSPLSPWRNAPTKPTKSESMSQPKGDDGSVFSLEKVAEFVKESRVHPDVIAWSQVQLKNAGFPHDTVGIANVIFKAVKEQIGYVRDPADSEHMKKAYLMLGDGVKLGFFAGGDCDDLVIATLSGFLAAAQSVGVKAAVVGQSYKKHKAIEHVLAAIYDEKGEQWLYMDPSSNFPLGTCLTPFSRERVIEVPSGKLLCDAEVCLSGNGAKKVKPLPITEGLYVGVSGLPDGDWEPILFADPGSDNPVAHMLATNPTTPEEGMADGLLSLAKKLDAAIVDMMDAKDRYLARAGKNGLPFLDGVHWTTNLESAYQDCLAAGALASTYLVEAATGKRPVAIDDNGDTLLGSLDTDTTAIRTTKDGLFEMVNLATGSPIFTGRLPTRADKLLWADEVRTLALAPAVIVVAVVASAIITVAGVYAITKVTETIHATIQQAIAAYTDKQLIECRKEGGKDCPTPKELAEAYGIRRNADQKLKEVGDPLMDTVQKGIFIGGAVLTMVGLYKLGKEQGWFKGETKR